MKYFPYSYRDVSYEYYTFLKSFKNVFFLFCIEALITLFSRSQEWENQGVIYISLFGKVFFFNFTFNDGFNLCMFTDNVFLQYFSYTEKT